MLRTFERITAYVLQKSLQSCWSVNTFATVRGNNNKKIIYANVYRDTITTAIQIAFWFCWKTPLFIFRCKMTIVYKDFTHCLFQFIYFFKGSEFFKKRKMKLGTLLSRNLMLFFMFTCLKLRK